jgi:hypothetical protein
MTRLDAVARSTLGAGAPGAPGASALVALPGSGGLDGFSRAAGPDVAIQTNAGLVRFYAVFEVDPGTQEVRVRVISEAGQLIRIIPPASVREMLAAMGGYGPG